jgi:hypothetical protein
MFTPTKTTTKTTTRTEFTRVTPVPTWMTDDEMDWWMNAEADDFAASLKSPIN